VAPRWEIVPKCVNENLTPSRKERIRKYRGIKEDVYAPEFKPDTSLGKQLNLGDTEIIVTVLRPLRVALSQSRKREVLHRVHGTRDGRRPGEAVLLPRNKAQEFTSAPTGRSGLKRKVIVPNKLSMA